MGTLLEAETPEEGGPSISVLLADDDERDRSFLKEALDDEYEVLEAADGEEALVRVGSDRPDVVVMDVLMPRVGGIEVCRRMREDPATAQIPVILLTSQRGREVRLDGIAAGARDFLFKPIDVADFRVRVRNAGLMKRIYDQSETRFNRISELESLRDSLVHMIVHDLKTPLTTAKGNLELLGMALSGRVEPDLEGDVRQYLGGALSSVDSITEMIGSILDMSRLESNTLLLDLETVDLWALIGQARDTFGVAAERILMETTSTEHPLLARCDVHLMERVFQNLFKNALEYSPPDEVVSVVLRRDKGALRIAVQDRGPGVPPDSRETIFHKFGQVSGTKKIRKSSIGLGLAFSKLAIEAHEGRIGVEEREGGGSVFWVELPSP